MNKRLQVFKYLFGDLIAAGFAWAAFFLFRKHVIESHPFGSATDSLNDPQFILGLLFVPMFWLSLYALTGFYKNIYRKSRLRELGQTIWISLLGSVLIFFALLLDDEINTYKDYYQNFITLFTLHFTFTYAFRLVWTTQTIHRIQRREIGFNTLLVGSNENAWKLYNEINEQKKGLGYRFVGFVHLDSSNGYSHELQKKLPHVGELAEVKKIITQYQAEEVIVAIESSEHDYLNHILNELHASEVIIKIIPDTYDMLAGSVKINNIFDAPLIEIKNELMPAWQQSVKRMMDIVLSLLSLVFFFPLYVAIAIAVKLTSKGPVFYSHERIGLQGKPFKIFKFRTMVQDAEKRGPALSSDHDPRITSVGRFLRKVRLDELPQFYNVLIGNMSLVGPRPERQFFIDQIVQRAPHYKHLHKVKPGITSWGQVKYGYAENVDQMIERLKYDIMYIENMSLALDIKILIYTILIVVQGRGK